MAASITEEWFKERLAQKKEMKLTKNAQAILRLRYLQRDAKGRYETPEQLFRRVAHNIALADLKYTPQGKRLWKQYRLPYWEAVRQKKFLELAQRDPNVKNTEKEFYELMTTLDFLPNTPTLFNAGRELQQLAACFVLPVEDDLDAIFRTLHSTALIHKSGGGTGFSFTRLRPRGDIVGSTQGKASGPVSFMKIFDCATEQIKQGGKRRGANMGILRVDHPDIEEFIAAKEHEGVLANFNISVTATDTFMQAVQKNQDYELINPRTKKAVGKKSARKVFNQICAMAWRTADPGIIFLDTINKTQPTPQLGEIESTNPCGEVPLLPYEACNLGSINLAHFVRDGQVDYERLKSVVWKAVHFLDNVIDMSNYPLPEIAKIVHGNRKIGLGVMGFADLLITLGTPYASDEALIVSEEVIYYLNHEAKKASTALAKERGVFPNFKSSRYDTSKAADRVRNATRTSVAPTGTISLIAGCSSGIEPLFALTYHHTLGDKGSLLEISQPALNAAKNRGLPKKTLHAMLVEGSAQGIPGVPKELKELLKVAHEIDSETHVRMQAAFQKYTDNAVSKTVNLPASATPGDVEKIYLLAWKLGCKGISIYREGSKKRQVLTAGRKIACPDCETRRETSQRCQTCG